MTDYVLSSDEDTQKVVSAICVLTVLELFICIQIALKFLASVVSDTEASLVLPPLTTELLKLLKVMCLQMNFLCVYTLR